jgi:hypothetical protein
MISIGTRQHGAARRRSIDVRGDNYFKGEWMESGDDPVLSPTVFLIEQPPNATLVPHFHRQNQFQLFVGGGGTLGKHAVETVTVHYAGAYTGYGPLISGSEGIKYFTIRPVCEAGMMSLDEARDKMIRGPKRHESVGPVRVLDEAGRRAATRDLDKQGEHFLLAISDEGLGVGEVCLDRGQSMNVQRHAASQGEFIVVLSGRLQFGERELTEWESIFVSADEPFPDLLGAEGGAQCVILHCPPREKVYFPSTV